MVTVVLLDTGEELDIVKATIRYVKRAADIGDVTKLTTSYSWGMEFPFTPHNTIVLKGLGTIGDTSDSPYIKLRVDVLDNGLPIVQNGLLQIKTTENGEYKAYIQDGIVDFIRDVAVDKISEVIDLSDLTHENTIANIIASFTNDTYRYIVANYNGPPLPNFAGTTNLSPFAMVPSINIKYLFDKIMTYYGWTYSGDLFMEGLWMTYPNATGFVTNEALPPILETHLIAKTYTGPNLIGTNRLQLEQATDVIDNDFIGVATTINGNPSTYYFKQPGNYRISFAAEGSSRLIVPPITIDPMSIFLERNGVPITSPLPIFTNLSDEDTVQFDMVAYVGTGLSLGCELIGGAQQRVIITEGSLKIEKLGVQEVNFSEALIKVKVKDFFKEILTRRAVTPFVDLDHKNIHFISVENLLNAEILDWTDKYVRRVSEAYVYDSYAKVNTLTHEYDQDGQDFNDGKLNVRNENLDEEKNLYKSFTHSPLEELVTYQGVNFPEYEVNNFKMFEVELKEDPDTGDLLADYKPIKDRFYIMESETRIDQIAILGNGVFSFPLAVLGGNTFKDIVDEKYQDINRILNDTRLHSIELLLTKWDVATLDLTKRYYFAQEAAVYKINSLTWKTEELCTAEFVRLTEIQNNALRPSADGTKLY